MCDESGTEFGAFMIGVILGSFVFGCIGGCIGDKECTKAWQKAAIERGVGRFHPDTGIWEWTVEPVKKTPEKEK